MIAVVISCISVAMSFSIRRPRFRRRLRVLTLGAGTVPNTAEKLRVWVRDPQTLKEDCNMPNMQLTDTELNQIVGYLLTLK